MSALPLFVYGTLMADQPAFHLLATESAHHWPAILNGAILYDLGRYPMAVVGRGLVQGEAHWLHAESYATTLAHLDAYEGNEYIRHAQPVHLRGDHRTVTAWVYLGVSTPPPGFPLVADGDWRAWRENHGRRP